MLSVPAPTPAAGADLLARRLREAERATDADRDEEAVRLVVELVGSVEEAEDPALAVRLQVLLCRLAVRCGDFQGAGRAGAEALARAQACGDDRLVATARVCSAGVLSVTGEHERALAELESALPVLTGGAPGVVRVHAELLLGRVLGDLGLVEAGRTWFVRAQHLARGLGELVLETRAAIDVAASWVDLGDLCRDRGDPDGAADAWQEGLRASQALLAELADRPHTARQCSEAMLHRAQGLLRLGRDEEALAALVELRDRVDGPLPAAVGLGLAEHIAALLQRQGDLDGAFEEIEHAILAAEGAGAKQVLIGLYEQGAAIAEQRGDLATALDWFRTFHRMGQEAVEEAGWRGQALTVRLDTERAQAEGEAERQRASALALANQTLTDRTSRLEREVMLDPLTGVPNRRTLDAQLASAHRDAVARGDPLFVAMLDVDRFKQVNDTYSHAVGDVVLRRLATLVQEHARAVDLLARYGGEEFVVVLAVSALAAAVAACERIRARIQSEDFSPIAPGLTVTASLGVADIAAFPGPEAGLRRVDELLYAAKAAGRNRVMS